MNILVGIFSTIIFSVLARLIGNYFNIVDYDFLIGWFSCVIFYESSRWYHNFIMNRLMKELYKFDIEKRDVHNKDLK